MSQQLKYLQDEIRALALQLVQAGLTSQNPGAGTLANLLKTKGLGESVIGQVAAGTYKGNLTEVGLRWSAAVAKLRARHNLTRSSWTPQTVFDFPAWEELRQALAVAQRNAGQGMQRGIIWFLGDPGTGKTNSKNRLVNEYGARSANGRESWRKSYFSVLKSMAKAIGLTQTPRSADECEDKLLAALSGDKTTLLALDEVEFCGTSAVNLWRKLLNDGNLVLVVFCLPEFFQDFHRLGGIHSDQLMQRNVAVIEARQVQASEAAKFLEYMGIGDAESREADSAILASRANGSDTGSPNQGGGYRLCYAVAEAMAAGSTLEEGIAAFRGAQGFHASRPLPTFTPRRR